MSTIDTHTARFTQMVTAAQGKPDIYDALLSAGFTVSEITDNHADIISELAHIRCLQEEDQRDWQEHSDGDVYQ